jgi:dihydroflavonol-4-reductase
MVNVFITGATGFVGSHIAREMLENGHSVRILRRSTSKLDALQGLEASHAVGSLFEVDELIRHLKGIDWVIHTAAVSEYWRSSKAEIYKTNVDGTRNLLLAAEQAGVKRFIFTSSAAAVGYWGGGRSAHEDTFFNIDPKLSPYGHSKFLAEAEVYKAIRRGLDCVILNPAVILGPGDLNLISGSLVVELARGTSPVMPQAGGTTYIDVRDVAKSHLAAAEKGRTGERYLLGSVDLTHKALWKLIAAVIGAKLPVIPAPPEVIPVAAKLVDWGRALGLEIPAEGNQLRLSRRHIYFDCRKAHRELHEPEITIVQSIRDTYAWYKAQGVI